MFEAASEQRGTTRIADWPERPMTEHERVIFIAQRGRGRYTFTNSFAGSGAPLTENSICRFGRLRLAIPPLFAEPREESDS
jgi:hypothetical protein